MKQIYIKLLLLLVIQTNMHAEYIVFRTNQNNEIVPLDQKDLPTWEKIYKNIFCKYKMPECFGNRQELKTEKYKKFRETPEECFLRETIQAQAGKNYGIAFFPTLTCQLYCAKLYFKKKPPFVHPNNPTEVNKPFVLYRKKYLKDIKEKITYHQTTMPEIEQKFDKINKVFYKELFIINNSLVKYLKDQFNIEPAAQATEQIRKNINNITGTILSDLITAYESFVSKKNNRKMVSIWRK